MKRNEMVFFLQVWIEHFNVYIYILIGAIFNNQTNLIHARFFSWFGNNSGPRPPHRGGFKITLRNITLGRFLRTSDQLGNTTRQHTTFTTDRKPCPGRDSKPAIPANERPQTHASNRAATGIGVPNIPQWNSYLPEQIILRDFKKGVLIQTMSINILFHCYLVSST
jgi:hypothetical protein